MFHLSIGRIKRGRSNLTISVALSTWSKSGLEVLSRSTESAAVRNQSFTDLVRGVILFNLCKYKFFYQTIPSFASQPFLGFLVKEGIRATAFRHFCGGEGIQDSFKYIHTKLQLFGISVILDHSVEEIEDASYWDINLQNKLKLIDIVSQIGGIHSIPLKCTSLLSSSMLETITTLLKTVPADEQYNDIDDALVLGQLSADVRNLYDSGLSRLRTICTKAASSKIRILLDAEQSYRQPAIEMLARALSQEFNVSGQPPVLFNTFQMYLSRSSNSLQSNLAHAKKHNYVFAVKLVRGAYILSESERAKSMGYSNPILDSKFRVDQSYDAAVESILSEIALQPSSTAPHVIIASHNKESILHTITLMEKLSLASNIPNVYFAQILGMCDHITLSLADSRFNVAKLVCCGEFDQLFPWLVRRFHENKDILGAMQKEKHIYFREILKRLSVL